MVVEDTVEELGRVEVRTVDGPVMAVEGTVEVGRVVVRGFGRRSGGLVVGGTGGRSSCSKWVS